MISDADIERAARAIASEYYISEGFTPEKSRSMAATSFRVWTHEARAALEAVGHESKEKG